MALGAFAAERRRQPARLLDRQHRLSAVHAAGQEPEDRRAAARTHRARGQRRLGHRQQDDLLRDRRRGHQAQRQVLPARPRAPTRTIWFMKRRTNCSTSASAARATTRSSCCEIAARPRPSFATFRPPCRRRRWKIIVPRQADHEYDVDHRGDLFYIRTNKGAKNFRVVTAPVSDPSEKNWKEFVAHRPGGEDRRHRSVCRSCWCCPNGKTAWSRSRSSISRPTAAPGRVSRAGLRGSARRRTANSTRRRCATTINRWSRRVRSSITT